MIYFLMLLCFLLTGAYVYLWTQYCNLKDDVEVLLKKKESGKFIANVKDEFDEEKLIGKIKDEFNKFTVAFNQASQEQWNFLREQADNLPHDISWYVSDALNQADYNLMRHDDLINKALQDAGYAKEVVNKCISKKTREKHGIKDEPISKEMTDEQKQKINDILNESSALYAEKVKKQEESKKDIREEMITEFMPEPDFPQDPDESTTEIASFFDREKSNTEQFDLDEFISEVKTNAKSIKQQIEDDYE